MNLSLAENMSFFVFFYKGTNVWDPIPNTSFSPKFSSSFLFLHLRASLSTLLPKKLTFIELFHGRLFRSLSVQLLSHVRLFSTPWTAACQASLSITALGVYPNSCPLSQWCHPTISYSVVPFFSRLQSFPALGSFPMSQFFTSSGGQSIGVSASALVLPMNIQDWFPLGWTDWISLQSKGLSRVFSNTTVQKHQFFSTQLAL